MKNNLITSALVAIVGLAFIGAPITTQAQTTTTAPATTATPAKAKAKKSDKTPYKGAITAIDATSVTVANKSTTLTLAIAATTKFEKDKKPATIADFAVGDSITGSYMKDAAGAMTASSVHKKTTMAATKTTAAPATTPATQ